ncbi:hypothetical protein RI129_001029 [Pyrocoelia pectoralis]|uniref:small monomeric GTPase n=1 Tax=Pyrocoelia pectoralis TaxID=417401 RepID=A0AAN7ZJP3_9COLE
MQDHGEKSNSTQLERNKFVKLGHPHQEAALGDYITRHFIATYDLLYRHSVTFDNVITEVEILDTSKCGKDACLYEHIRWGEAFVIVYSVNDKHSFREAQELLGQLSKLKLPSYYTSLLLGNKRDLDHCRQICVDDGQELSLQYGCQFYEVSAAENFAGVSLAFQSLLKEAKSVQLLKALPIRRKLGVNSVSKVLGNIFGKNSKGDRKKRPSLSI